MEHKRIITCQSRDSKMQIDFRKTRLTREYIWKRSDSISTFPAVTLNYHLYFLFGARQSYYIEFYWIHYPVLFIKIKIIRVTNRVKIST